MKRNISILVILALVMTLFVGCDGESEDTSAVGDNSTEEIKESVELVVWESMEGAVSGLFNEEIKQFEAEYPHIKVTPTNYSTEDLTELVQTAILGGSGPDIMYVPSDFIGTALVGDLIRPVTDFVSSEFLATLDDISLADSYLNDEQWMIPDVNGNQIALLYNKNIVDKEPTTWETFLELAQEHTNPSENQFGFLYQELTPFWFAGFLNGFGGAALNEDGDPTLDTPEMIEALNFAIDIKDEYGLGYEGMDGTAADSLFKQGNVAMILNGAWSWAEYAEDENIDLGICPMPLPNGETALFYSSTKGYVVSSEVDESKGEAIETFFEYFLSPEVNADFALANSQAPTNLEARELDIIVNDELQDAAVTTIESTVPMPIISEMRAFWDAVEEQLNNVINLGMDPAEGARLMQEKAEKDVKLIRGE